MMGMLSCTEMDRPAYFRFGGILNEKEIQIFTMRIIHNILLSQLCNV